MDLELTGKAALVTGASEGTGMGIARALAEEGVRMAMCARTGSGSGAARMAEARTSPVV